MTRWVPPAAKAEINPSLSAQVANVPVMQYLQEAPQNHVFPEGNTMHQQNRLIAFTVLFLSFASVAPMAHAADPQDKQVTCESSWPQNVLPKGATGFTLKSKPLPGGRIEWYGRFRMYSPDGNYFACNLRQIRFSSGHLVNELPQGSPNGPIIKFEVQHGLFRCRAKDMIVDPNFVPSIVNSDFIAYRADAREKDGKGKSGFYYAKISIIGVPAPVH